MTIDSTTNLTLDERKVLQLFDGQTKILEAGTTLSVMSVTHVVNIVTTDGNECTLYDSGALVVPNGMSLGTIETYVAPEPPVEPERPVDLV